MIFTLTTYTIYFTITLIFLVGLLDGLSQCCYQYRVERQRIAGIAFMTKKQLIELARDYKVAGYSKYNKYQLANYLIEVLC